MKRFIWLLLAAALERARWRAGQAQRRYDDRGSRVDCARGRRRSDHGRGDRQGLSGSALRRSEAELHPQAAESRRPDRRRPRARDRLAAAAHPAEPQRENPAGRRGLSRRVAAGEILEIPAGQVTRAMGDVHPLATRTTGSIRRTARRSPRTIADKFSELRPNDRAFFEQNLADFTGRVDAGEKRWLADWRLTRRRRSSPITDRFRTSRSASASTSSATSSRSRAFRRRRSTRSISSPR